jgi:hypothetical protein
VSIVILVLVAAALVAVGAGVRRMYLNVPLRHFAILTRRLGVLRPSASFAEAVSAQTRLLQCGQPHWVAWWLYDVKVLPEITIPPDSVGVVRALMGKPLKSNQTVARPVNCDQFRDFGGFLARGGQQGPQVEVLPGGNYAIHPEIFEVEIVRRATVPIRSIGLVKANVGQIMSPGNLLASHVDCDHFQDGVAFMELGGEQGIQQAVLPGGSNYAINPKMFDVITVDNVDRTTLDLSAKDLLLVSVDAEDVGVVIVTESRERDGVESTDEPAPGIPGHDHFQRPWEFLANGGRVGPQSEVLPGGAKYAINPLFARVVHIPTRELILSWQSKDAAGSRYDSALQPIEITIDGFKLWVELTQTLAIPGSSAPYLVKRFGEDEDEDGADGRHKPAAVKRLVERTIGPVVQSYFNEVAAQLLIEDFVNRVQDEVRNTLFAQVDHQLKALRVEARLTTIQVVRFESDEINAQLRKVADLRQEINLLKLELGSQEFKNELEQKKLDMRKNMMAAEEEVLIGLFGRDHRRDERILEREVTAPVPQVIVSGNGSTVEELALPRLRYGSRRVPPSERRGWTIDLPEQSDVPTTEIEGSVEDPGGGGE